MASPLTMASTSRWPPDTGAALWPLTGASLKAAGLARHFASVSKSLELHPPSGRRHRREKAFVSNNICVMISAWRNASPVGGAPVTKRKMGDDRQRQDRSNADSIQPAGREFARLQIADQIAKLRIRAGLSQAALADRIGTKQAGVARMERRDYQGYTVTTLAKIAAATGARLEVRLAPPSRPSRRRSPGHSEPNGR